MTRMLKSSASVALEESPIASSAIDDAAIPRKDLLNEQKHNRQLQMIFGLSAEEAVLESSYSILSESGGLGRSSFYS